MNKKKQTTKAYGVTMMPRMEWGMLVLVLALCSGAAFTFCDLMFNGVALSFDDVGIAILLASVVAVPATLFLAMILRILFLFSSTPATRRLWLTSLPPLLMVVVCSVVAAILLDDMKDWVRFMFLVLSLPISCLVGVWAGRSQWLVMPWRAVIVCAALPQVCAFLMFAFLAVPMANGWFTSLLPWLSVGLGISLLVWVWATVPVRPIRGLIGVTASLVLSVIVVVVASSSQQRLWGPQSASASVSETPRSVAMHTASSPNVVLVVLDTTRRDHLGCYGHVGGLTPTLDSLAAEGVVYEQAFSQSPWTVPSHATLFTGLYPVSHGCSNEHHLWLDDEFETLAETLGRTGYQSLALNSNVYLSQCNLLQGFDQAVLLRGAYDEPSIHKVAQTVGRPERWVDKGASEGITELHQWFERSYDPDAPFFLFLNLYEAHVKYLPPHAERSMHLPEGKSALEAARVGLDYLPTQMHIKGAIDPPEQETLRAMYAAEIRYQDRRLGEIMEMLRQKIDLDNTLVIVTADHGENLGEAGRWEHLYAINDLLIHVPLIIRYPKWFSDSDKLANASRIPGLCELADVMPTILEEVGVKTSAQNLPGRSLRPDGFIPKTSAVAQVWPYYLYLNKVEPLRGFERGLSDFLTQRRVLRTDSMKFVWTSSGTHELYDMGSDPNETMNLASTMPDVTQKMLAQLESQWASLPSYEPKQYDPKTAKPIDDRALMQLKSLGYVGD